MKRFSSSYVFRKSAYALLGCEQFGEVKTDWAPIACVVLNLLQRGMPTHPSERLRTDLGGQIWLDMDRPARKLITHERAWGHTIKGAPGSDYNPALEFFTSILPDALPAHMRYVVGYILPEARISDIVENCDARFTEQCVDFYCPRANLVIEVDGSQHDRGTQPFLDRDRDLYLRANGVDTVRVRTDDLSAREAADLLVERFDAGEELPEDVGESDVFAYEIAMRVQVAVVELVRQGMLSPDDPTWTIDLQCDRPDVEFGTVATSAVEDVIDLFENICVNLFLDGFCERFRRWPRMRMLTRSPCIIGAAADG